MQDGASGWAQAKPILRDVFLVDIQQFFSLGKLFDLLIGINLNLSQDKHIKNCRQYVAFFIVKYTVLAFSNKNMNMQLPCTCKL